VPENDSGILGEFEEFLKQREVASAQAAQEDDEEIEIWDEKGRGARIRRSRAKPFLNSLGIDLDPEPSEGDGNSNDGDGKSKGKPRQSTGPKSANTQTGVARKYFVKTAPAAK
jgi:hypothetical protein